MTLQAAKAGKSPRDDRDLVVAASGPCPGVTGVQGGIITEFELFRIERGKRLPDGAYDIDCVQDTATVFKSLPLRS